MRVTVIIAVVALPWGSACGGTVGEPRQEPAAGGTTTAQGGFGWGGVSPSVGGNGGTATGGVTSTYVDPGCPEVPVPAVYKECEPLGDGSDCGPGEGCYPITEYATKTCESETFEMLCLSAGTGVQWDSCSTLTDCAPGFTCVVSTDGTLCSKMCDPRGTLNCPAGLFCDAVDLQGIGICF